MSAPYKGTDIEIWDGTCVFTPNVGMTPFGFYDSDLDFQKDAIKVARFCASRLGWPMLDVELQSGSFFTCFEEAITAYGNTIYEFKVKENYLSLEGGSTNIDANSMVLEPTLQRVIEIAKNYGSEAEVGGNLTLYKGFLDLKEGVQDYDLDEWAHTQGVTGGIEIRKIFYEAPPAILRYFDPYAGTGTGIQSLMDAFDFGSYSPGVNFLLMPISHDLLKIQAIEFNDQVRKSSYSFQIVNNKLKIFPIPTQNCKLRIEYYKLSDKKKLNTKTSIVTSMSTLRMDYSVTVPERSGDWYESATASFAHNLGTTEVTVQCYEEKDGTISQFIPYEVKVIDENNISVTFAESATGYIVIGYPDTETIVNGVTKMNHRMYFDVNVLGDGTIGKTFEHNLGTKDINVQVYQEVYNPRTGKTEYTQIIPDSISIVDVNRVNVGFRKYITKYNKVESRTKGYVVIGYPKRDVEDDGSEVITNVSEVPYENPTYAKINSVGRQWIFNYTLALARELLAYVRGKYSTLPIPDSEATLNQADLLTDARSEKERLLTQLREMLEGASRKSQLEQKAQEAEFVQKTLQGVPMVIFIG